MFKIPKKGRLPIYQPLLDDEMTVDVAPMSDPKAPESARLGRDEPCLLAGALVCWDQLAGSPAQVF